MNAGKVGVEAAVVALNVIWKHTGTTEIPISQVLTLLHLETHGEMPMADLSERTGVVLSTISRNVSKLGPGPTPRDPGLGWVEAFEDPWNRKRKLVRLTTKGQRVMAEINSEVARRVLNRRTPDAAQA